MTKLGDLLLCLLLAGCSASGGVITYSEMDSGYSPQEFAYAGGPGEIWTEVMDNPFTQPKPELDQAVTDAMYAAHFGPATRFATMPGPNARRTYHVRLIFNGPETNAMAACGAVPPVPPIYRGGDVSFFAAFCRDDRALTFLRAAGDKFTGPEDPRFIAFIREATIRLFPPQNPDMHNQLHDHCQMNDC
ncbi:MAG TPA: hypothetical protein VN821_07680 [Candidatus Udaeobacter sp.]|nr:hypothetical protein [Candidatus Udaeobacter sp.]